MTTVLYRKPLSKKEMNKMQKINRNFRKGWFLSAFLFMILTAKAQLFGPPQLVTDQADRPRHVISGDMDGDGNIDILSTSQTDDVVAWYENTDGEGTFGPLQLIDVLNQLMFLEVADLNDDGDLDVIVSVTFSNELLWYENLGGGAFGPQQLISDAFERFEIPVAGDMAGDGDLDVVVATDFDDTIRWFENGDGEGTFSEVHVVSNQGNNGRDLRLGDLDGDGDLDIVAESAGSECLSWYENTDGEGTFGGPTVIDPAFAATTDIALADFDGDGDLDIATVKISGLHFYYENTDGQGTFWVAQLIPNSPDGVFSLFAEDLDNDGDMDIVSTGGGDSNNVLWFENDGTATFSPPEIITNELSSQSGAVVMAADLDNDGDKDIFYNDASVDKVIWHENLTVLSLASLAANHVIMHPNPAENCLQIEITAPIDGFTVILHTVEGQEVLRTQSRSNECIGLGQLSSGLYTATIETAMGTIQKKFVKK